MNKGKQWMLLLTLMLLLCIAPAALGAQITVRRADGVGGSVNMWERSSSKKYLFLPAYMHDQPLEITYSGTRSVSIDDEKLESGAVSGRIRDGSRILISKDSSHVSVLESENLPAVHITTQSGSLARIHKRKSNKEAGHIQIVTARGDVVCDAPLEYIKGHGNATFIYEKKPYQIKLEKKASFLGMNAGKRYVLLANQHENSLLRNRITLDLARELGLEYTPECVSVDLYVNGDYRGSYLLTDKVEIADGSVEISNGSDALEFANEAYLERGGKLETYGKAEYEAARFKGIIWPREPEDVTGGYLFELEYRERYADEISGLCTEQGQPVVVKEPEEMSMAQGRYAYELLCSFERAIFDENGMDHETGRHYTEIADFDSLVRKYMIEEVSKNYDGNKSSQYFYKDCDAIDPLLYAGPVWDYDSAWGNYAREGHMESVDPKGLSIARQGYSYSWWPALYKQEDFRQAVRRVYQEELRPLLQVLIGSAQPEEASAVRPLAAYEQELTASAEMNFLRWRVFNHETRAVKTGEDYPANIRYLRSFIQKRMEYLDSTW